MARGSSRGPGSSPRRPASKRPAPRARSARQAALGRAASTAAAGWRDRITSAKANRRTVRRVSFGIVLLFLVILVAPTLRAYLQQRSHSEDLETQIAQRESNIDELEREKRRWHDPAYVQAQARERFGYLMPGETS